jgi:hypothetical protein
MKGRHQKLCDFSHRLREFSLDSGRYLENSEQNHIKVSQTKPCSAVENRSVIAAKHETQQFPKIISIHVN